MPYLANHTDLSRDIRNYWMGEGQFDVRDDAKVKHLTDFLVTNWLTPQHVYGLDERQATWIAEKAVDSAREALDLT